MRRLFLTLVFVVTAITIGYSQNTGSVAGKVTDVEFNNEPMPLVNIILKGTSKGTTTDFDGLFKIDNLDSGKYELEFSFVGYKTQVIPVEVVAGKVTEVNVPMGANAASLDEIVITTTTRKESEVALLLDQKKATEIKQSIGAEELSRKGVSDASGAVSKISGISKQEGSSNVYVRGLGDRYLNTTFNGLALPSNDVRKKNLDLKLFSSDIIENVSVSKAYATRFYGDFSAGNVNITSKQHKGKSSFDVSLGTGINLNAIDKDFVIVEGTNYFGDYKRFQNNPFAVVLSHGFDPESAGLPVSTNFSGAFGKSFDLNDDGSKLGVFLTTSFGNDFEYRKGSATDFTLTEKKAFIDNAEEYEYGTTTTAMLGLNYKVDDNNTLKFVSLFINDASSKVGYFGIDGKGRSRDAILDTDQGFYQANYQFDQTQMFVNQIISKHVSNDFTLDWGFGYNLVDSRQPDRKRISVENYQYALDSDPTTFPVFYSNVDFDNQRYFQNINDEEFNGRVNLAYNLSDNIKFNIGYTGKRRDRFFDNIRYGYDIVDGDYQIQDVNNLDAIFNLNNLNINSSSNGIYEIKVINPIPGIGNTNRPGLPENTYHGSLGVYGAYLNTELKVGEKWLFIPGVRFESINQKIEYNVINLGNSGIANKQFEKTLFLPSFNVKYAINEDHNLRFSASQTISLPEFKEVAPYNYEDISTRVGGNPDLLEKGYSEILNLDFKYEWFITKSELLSFALFEKQIKDPVNLIVGADATGTQRFFRTGEKAIVRGVEGEFRKNLVKDVDENNILSLGVNATLMYTEQDLYPEIDGETYDVSFENKTSDKLQGASPFIINADINYSPVFKNYQPTANLVFSYFYDRIDALGSGQLGNIIEKGVPTLDFILKNKIKDNFEINFAAKNLLNPRVTYFRETSLGDINVNSVNGKGVTNYKRGVNLSLNLKYKF